VAGETSVINEKSSWVGIRLAKGRYQVTAKLGEGGMAIVYRAHDAQQDRDVVVKAPRSTLLQEAEFTARFLREIRSLVDLAHPHIVEVIDVDEHEGMPFAILRYLAGGSLRDRLQRGPDGEVVPFQPNELSGWVEDIADALDFIHAKGFIHRDVKCDNILFDVEGNAFLSDFGIAKALAHESPAHAQTAFTAKGLVMGTPEYLAPELIMGEPSDGRADQYALGVVLYELLAGQRPFDGPNPAAILVKHTSEPPKPLRDVAPAVSPALASVVHKALAKQPDNRYSDCRSLARAVCWAVAESEVQKSPRLGNVTCPSCGQRLRVPVHASAKRYRCPACKKAFDVPGKLGISVLPDSAESTGGAPANEDRSTKRSGAGLSTGMLAPASRRMFSLERDHAPIQAKRLSRTPPRVVNDSGNLDGASKPKPKPRKTNRIRLVMAGVVVGALAAGIALAVTLAPTSGIIKIDLEDAPADVVVRLDGQVIPANALAEPLKLKSGEHHLLFTGEDLQTLDRVFAVKSGSNPPLSVKLQPPDDGVLKVVLSEPKASVTLQIDGQSFPPRALGLPLLLRPGRHRLVVEGPGYQAASQDFLVRAGSNPPLTVKLEPIRPAPVPVVKKPFPPGSTALRFDGEHSYVQAAREWPQIDAREVTIAAWARFSRLPTDVEHFMTIAGKSGLLSDLDLQAEADNRFHFYIGTGHPDQVSSSTVIEVNRWYHVAATYKAMDRMTLYVNGKLEVAKPIPRLRKTNSNPFTIGWSAEWKERHFAGLICDVSLWSRALTQDQITALMTQPPKESAPGLLGYWPCDEGQGYIALDHSSYKNHGKLGGTSPSDAPKWVKIQPDEVTNLP
jgi:serine/threonine protein kinase